MQEIGKTDFGFAIDACATLVAIVLITVTLVSAEVYLTNGKPIAIAEIENGCAPCGASMALAAR